MNLPAVNASVVTAKIIFRFVADVGTMAVIVMFRDLAARGKPPNEMKLVKIALLIFPNETFALLAALVMVDMMRIEAA